jgi:hypothetical protein
VCLCLGQSCHAGISWSSVSMMRALLTLAQGPAASACERSSKYIRWNQHTDLLDATLWQSNTPSSALPVLGAYADMLLCCCCCCCCCCVCLPGWHYMQSWHTCCGNNATCLHVRHSSGPTLIGAATTQLVVEAASQHAQPCAGRRMTSRLWWMTAAVQQIPWTTPRVPVP